MLTQMLLAARPSQGIVTSGLVLHVDFGDAACYPGSGTAFTDLSGNGHTGTLINGPSFSAANGGQIIFDGVNDYASTSLTQPQTNAYTIEVWMKTLDTANGGFGKAFVSNRGSGAGQSIELGINPFQGNIGAVWAGGQSNFYINQRQTNATNLNDGNWRQLVGVFQQASGTTISPSSFSIYTNGLLMSVNQNALQYGSRTSPFGPGLGGTEFMRVQAWGTYLSGSLSIVRIYNRAPSAAEVARNFEAQKARFGL